MYSDVASLSNTNYYSSQREIRIDYFRSTVYKNLGTKLFSFNKKILFSNDNKDSYKFHSKILY